MSCAASIQIADYEFRSDAINGRAINVTSYRLDKSCITIIESKDPGAEICRVTGSSRQESLSNAYALATNRLTPLTSVSSEQERIVNEINQIILDSDGGEKVFQVGEFLDLPSNERMAYMFSGKLSFVTMDRSLIPVGEAIEKLRSCMK